MVTQFIGDAIMATFNLPLKDAEHAANAVRAALDIVNLTAERTFDGERLKIRAGIATGPVIAGSVGGGGRQTYSLYGDTVNLSARLESLNKAHGTRILIDAATAERLRDIPVREIGPVPVARFLRSGDGFHTRHSDGSVFATGAWISRKARRQTGDLLEIGVENIEGRRMAAEPEVSVGPDNAERRPRGGEAVVKIAVPIPQDIAKERVGRGRTLGHHKAARLPGKSVQGRPEQGNRLRAR